MGRYLIIVGVFFAFAAVHADDSCLPPKKLIDKLTRLQNADWATSIKQRANSLLARETTEQGRQNVIRKFHREMREQAEKLSDQEIYTRLQSWMDRTNRQNGHLPGLTSEANYKTVDEVFEFFLRSGRAPGEKEHPLDRGLRDVWGNLLQTSNLLLEDPKELPKHLEHYSDLAVLEEFRKRISGASKAWTYSPKKPELIAIYNQAKRDGKLESLSRPLFWHDIDGPVSLAQSSQAKMNLLLQYKMGRKPEALNALAKAYEKTVISDLSQMSNSDLYHELHRWLKETTNRRGYLPGLSPSYPVHRPEDLMEDLLRGSASQNQLRQVLNTLVFRAKGYSENLGLLGVGNSEKMEVYSEGIISGLYEGHLLYEYAKRALAGKGADLFPENPKLAAELLKLRDRTPWNFSGPSFLAP